MMVRPYFTEEEAAHLRGILMSCSDEVSEDLLGALEDAASAASAKTGTVNKYCPDCGMWLCAVRFEFSGTIRAKCHRCREKKTIKVYQQGKPKEGVNN